VAAVLTDRLDEEGTDEVDVVDAVGAVGDSQGNPVRTAA
jgi:hypothetical protein